jgi:hypothetical protein
MICRWLCNVTSRISSSSIFIVDLQTRQRLLDIHDEYQEREQRWNRIAILLNYDDFSCLTRSTIVNQSVTYRARDSPQLHQWIIRSIVFYMLFDRFFSFYSMHNEFSSVDIFTSKKRKKKTNEKMNFHFCLFYS